jgi:hypothetical protein
MREIKSMWVTVAGPNGRNLGSVIEAWWFVADGVLSLCDESGHASGPTERLQPGQVERQVASRLRKDAWRAENGESDFGRPLTYPRGGVA